MPQPQKGLADDVKHDFVAARRGDHLLSQTPCPHAAQISITQRAKEEGPFAEVYDEERARPPGVFSPALRYIALPGN